jgi:hypothetical protein
MCVFSLLFFLKKTTVVAHGGWAHATAMATAVARRLPAAMGLLQLPSAIAVAHGGRVCQN